MAMLRRLGRKVLCRDTATHARRVIQRGEAIQFPTRVPLAIAEDVQIERVTMETRAFEALVCVSVSIEAKTQFISDAQGFEDAGNVALLPVKDASHCEALH